MHTTLKDEARSSSLRPYTGKLIGYTGSNAMVFNQLKETAFIIGERMGLFNLLQNNDTEQRLFVLAYHRVDEAAHRPWLDPALISASPAQFAAQMELVARRYHPVCIEEVLEALEQHKNLPRNAVLVTVDDGYRDFQEFIFPIASRFGILPVLFVPTAFAGQGVFWWDKLFRAIYYAPEDKIDCSLGHFPIGTPYEKKRALEQLRVIFYSLPFAQTLEVVESLYAAIPMQMQKLPGETLNWDELRALARAGATIAAHTHDHPILSRVSQTQAHREIGESQELIRREIGSALPVFAYPLGQADAYTREIVDNLRAEGFMLAFTTQEGSFLLQQDEWLSAPRIGVWPSLTLAKFHLHLTPAYDSRKRKEY